MAEDSAAEVDPFRSLPLTRSAISDVAALRLIGGIVTLAMAGWLVAIQASPRMLLLAALGAFVGVWWIVQFVRSARRVASASQTFLHLERDRMRLVDRGRCVFEIPWSDVKAVDVDEERLEVRVGCANGSDHYIYPSYGQLGVYELAEAVRNAFVASAPPALDGPAGGGV
ncbi:MAG: hypothetical protein AB7S26_28730 [Sandaracinaceae bacterium]